MLHAPGDVAGRRGQARRHVEKLCRRAERHAEQRRLRHVDDALRPAQQRLQHVRQHQHPDDLAQAQRRDRQVVAAHLQHRQAEQEPGAGRGQDRKRQRREERQVAPRAGGVRRQQRHGVGPHGKERDEAEIDQAGQPQLDVQAKPHQRVKADQHHHLGNEVVGQRRQGQHHREAQQPHRQPDPRRQPGERGGARAGRQQRADACRRRGARGQHAVIGERPVLDAADPAQYAADQLAQQPGHHHAAERTEHDPPGQPAAQHQRRPKRGRGGPGGPENQGRLRIGQAEAKPPQRDRRERHQHPAQVRGPSHRGQADQQPTRDRASNRRRGHRCGCRVTPRQHRPAAERHRQQQGVPDVQHAHHQRTVAELAEQPNQDGEGAPGRDGQGDCPRQAQPRRRHRGATGRNLRVDQFPGHRVRPARWTAARPAGRGGGRSTP